VAQDPPEAEQGLRINDADDDAIIVGLSQLPDPGGEAEILRLHVFGVLVDLLRVDLPTDPRSLQERLAVGSVVESREHRGHHFHQDGLPGLHLLFSFWSAAGVEGVYDAAGMAAPPARTSLSTASGFQPTYFSRPFTMKAG
jgi:hypothetical protein